MFKIVDLVNEKLSNDLEARSAIINGYMNLSAYAKQIGPDIEKKLYKKIKVQTIVVALSRLAILMQRNNIKELSIKLVNLTIQSNLIDYTFERNKRNLQKIAKFEKEININNGFFTVTLSSGEITIIAQDSLKNKIEFLFLDEEYITKFENLSSITIKFSKEYLSRPNLIFDLTKQLAVKNINIIEIISTATELTYLLTPIDVEKVVQAFTNLVT